MYQIYHQFCCSIQTITIPKKCLPKIKIIVFTFPYKLHKYFRHLESIYQQIVIFDIAENLNHQPLGYGPSMLPWHHPTTMITKLVPLKSKNIGQQSLALINLSLNSKTIIPDNTPLLEKNINNYYQL